MSRTRIPASVGLLVSGVLLAAGCLPIWEARDLQDRVESLEQRQSELRKSTREREENLKNMVERARSDVEEMEEVLERARTLLQRNSADLGAELQSTRRELQKLRGRVQETEFKLEKLGRELDLFRKDVDMRLAGSGGGMEMPDDPDELLAHGREKMKAGDYRAAQRAFEQFGAEFSDHGKRRTAQFLLAETYFEREEWTSAIVEYRKVLTDDAASSRIPEARYKIGVAFGKLGKCEQARPFFKSVLADSPKSDVGPRAEEKLGALDDGRCPL